MTDDEVQEIEKEIRTSPKYIPIPKILGKFNYLGYGKDTFNVLFMPFQGSSAIIVARNLTYDEALDTVKELNESLDTTKKEIRKRADEMKLELKDSREGDE